VTSSQLLEAVHACLCWARHFDGGDEAWRTLARAIIREEQYQARQKHPFSYLHHDLIDHGTMGSDEAGYVNRFLLELGGTPFSEVRPTDQVFPRTFEHRRRWACLGRWLAQAVSASYLLDPQNWGPTDEALYGSALAHLTPAARAHFPRNEMVLERTWQAAAALAA
jgi:hypothetical protein